ncbi:MAG TPA: selenocysteine-specific translation elongation factor [Actinomycetota bacterium]|nr:selenocysteine-specific translation elongation factor [Actinomycetota bacterium]
MHVIGTAGHVDHGKSTLVEKLTGMDPDRFAEEKRRGLTIEVGFAWFELPSGNEVGIVDVPGHERFIKNMLAGAGGVDVCLFVVAANEGWSAQSTEHLAIVDLLEVGAGVIALTKSDLVGPDERALAEEEVRERVAGTVLAGAPVVACSALTGEGIGALVAALDDVVQRASAPRDVERPRLWVDRVFTIAGAGTVVTGTLMGGSFALGDAVEIAPEGRNARIRSIQSHKHPVERIEPGNRTALNLTGLEREGAERGDAVLRPGQWRTTRTLDVKLHVLPTELVGRNYELTEKGAHLLYIGSAETSVRVKLFGDRRRLSPGESGYARLHLDHALPVGHRDRFVLRDAGRILTFGGGFVLDPAPPLQRRIREDHAPLWLALETDDPRAALDALVEESRILSVEPLTARIPIDVGDVDLPRLGDAFVSKRHLDELRERLRRGLAEHHGDHPLEWGMDRATARMLMDLEQDRFDALVQGMTGVVGEGAIVRLESHAVALDPALAAARDELLAKIDARGFAPPLAAELAADPSLVKALTDSGELVRIGDFYLTAERAAEARRLIRARIEEAGGITVAEIRDLLGTTRKYAVPLCEWLDATGATIRRGDLRILGPKP